MSNKEVDEEASEVSSHAWNHEVPPRSWGLGVWPPHLLENTWARRGSYRSTPGRRGAQGCCEMTPGTRDALGHRFW